MDKYKVLQENYQALDIYLNDLALSSEGFLEVSGECMNLTKLINEFLAGFKKTKKKQTKRDVLVHPSKNVPKRVPRSRKKIVRRNAKSKV